MGEQQQGVNDGPPDGAPVPELPEGAAVPAGRRRAWWKLAVVVSLAVAVVAVMASKGERESPVARADGTDAPEAGTSLKAPPADNPLDRALATGRPVVADFGRGTCMPCVMMKSVLEGIREDYAGKVEVVVVDIGEHPALAERVGVAIQPTQVFYDAAGVEASRHEGFMPSKDIVAELARLGVE
jgi:thioredoxin 1